MHHWAERDDPDHSWAIDWTLQEAQTLADRLKDFELPRIKKFGVNVKVLKGAAELCFPRHPLLGAIALSSVLGCQAIEMWNNGRYFEYSTASRAQIDVLKRTLKMFKISPTLHMHLKFIETEQDFVKCAKNAVDFASRLRTNGGVTCVLHPGLYGCTCPDFSSLSERDKYKNEVLLPEIAELLDYAKKARVIGVIENTSPDSDNILTSKVLFSPFKLFSLTEEINGMTATNSRVCLDIPHLFTGKPILSEKYDKHLEKLIEPLRRKIYHIHMSSIVPKEMSASDIHAFNGILPVIHHRHTPLPVGVVEIKAKEELYNTLKGLEEEEHEFFILEGAVNSQRERELKNDLLVFGQLGLRRKIDEKFYAEKKEIIKRLIGPKIDDWRVEIPLLAVAWWKKLFIGGVADRIMTDGF